MVLFCTTLCASSHIFLFMTTGKINQVNLFGTAHSVAQNSTIPDLV